MNDELKFYPAKYKNTYRNWLENIKTGVSAVSCGGVTVFRLITCLKVAL
mgnify:FL=1